MKKLLLFLFVFLWFYVFAFAQPTASTKTTASAGKADVKPEIKTISIYISPETSKRLDEIEKQAANLQDEEWRKKELIRLGDLYSVTLSTLFESNHVDPLKVTNRVKAKGDSLILTIQK